MTTIETISDPQHVKRPWLRAALVFLLGVSCFLLTQVFTRIPLLNWLQEQTGFVAWAVSNPLLTGVLIALSAGVFEESGRFIFKALALKPARTHIWEPIVFGLGHGICEAVWALAPLASMVGVLSLTQFVIPVVERLLAIALHVGFSVIVWNGFQLDHRPRYLLIAMLAHGLVNVLIPLVGVTGWGVLALEGLFAAVAVASSSYVFFSKKYYLRGQNEQEAF